MAGATAFCVKSAYRTGCGYVKAYTPSKNVDAMLSLVPEAVLKPYPHDKFKKDEKEAYKKEIHSAKALVLGPGLGNSKTATELVKIALLEKEPEQRVLIDADGLRVMAREGISELPAKCVVTPHMGEMAALTGLTVKELLADPVKAAREYADKTGAVRLLKGARTAVSDGRRVYINTSGCEAMATAGSGDVLSGIIGALLAEGMEPFEAACLGAFIHGLCGEICAQKYGNRPVMAGDLTEALCDVLKNY